MKAKNKFGRGVKYGIVKRILKRITSRKDKEIRKRICVDLKQADEELLDFLCACTPENLDEFIGNINIWLDMEAEMTGFETVKYTVGEGENIFKKVAIERELFHRNNKNS